MLDKYNVNPLLSASLELSSKTCILTLLLKQPQSYKKRKFSMTITVSDLRNCYADTCNKMIPALIDMRTVGYRMKLQEVQTLFTNSLWIQEKMTSGHKQFTHAVTGVTVEYQAHIKGKENTIAPGIQKQLLEQIQEHVNILSNEVFRYTTHHWKEEPDYDRALRNYLVRMGA
jgi:hypothetical protein